MTKRKRDSLDTVHDPHALPEQTPIKAGDHEPDSKRLHQRKSLFVHSLSTNTTTQSLIEHFSQSFPIKHAVAVLDQKSNSCRGFGFVAFADAEDAQRAHQDLNGSFLDGRRIKLDFAEPRHRESNDAFQSSCQRKSVETSKPSEPIRADQPLPSKLIVRNLPWSISKSEQLSRLFMSYGKVKQAYLVQKKAGQLAGFGFVLLRGRKNAEKALQGVNGKEVDGRFLAVDWAVTKATWESHKEQDNTVEDDRGVNQSILTAEGGKSPVDGSRLRQSSLSDASEQQASESGSESVSSQTVQRRREQNPDDNNSTLFIRNVPFDASDEALKDHFSHFGRIRYARIVFDSVTEKSRGSAFVCFRNDTDAKRCYQNAPARLSNSREISSVLKESHSLVQNDELDPSGMYTIDGRVLQVSRAVDKGQAAKFSEANNERMNDKDKDKRRLFLLPEGTLSHDSPLRQLLSPSEIAAREASAKQRKSLVQNNPSLHLSLNRLSIRNLPRFITSKDLKALAREAVVGFAKDVKAGKRSRLSKDELSRSDNPPGEQTRKERGKGIVKQAKVVFEGREGGKVDEKTGGGRSRGYGFIEYFSHRSALMGLRWLNGHPVDYQAHEDEKSATRPQRVKDKKKRLIVEFAIENAQVVRRREDRQSKAHVSASVQKNGSMTREEAGDRQGQPRRMTDDGKQDSHEQARKQQIIARKRASRRGKRQGAS